MSEDNIKGMLMGAFLGDALGAPHEFRCNSKTPYTGILEHSAFNVNRFQGKRELQIGQITDDSEMTITLLRSLIENQGYCRDKIILAYLEWANSGIWMMGNNTRHLFKGIKTIKGYQKRLLAYGSSESQSNGALMRCSPLALLKDDMAITYDVSITNPHPTCVECNIIYVTILKCLLRKENSLDIFNKIRRLVTVPEIRTLFTDMDTLINLSQTHFIGDKPVTIRDLSINKGWCLHGLWVALYVLMFSKSYAETMDWIIHSHPGSDTDTNACIGGAVWGAKNGFIHMYAESITQHNIDTILSVNPENGPTPRPLIYGLQDFHELAYQANTLYMATRDT